MSDSVVQHCCPMQFGWEKLCLKCIGFVFHQKIISQSVMLLKNVQANERESTVNRALGGSTYPS
jgi:hypothetical protein